jgi:hypothetical protein
MKSLIASSEASTSLSSRPSIRSGFSSRTVRTVTLSAAVRSTIAGPKAL